MKTKHFLSILILSLFTLIGIISFAVLARNPASESENYQLPAQVLPSLAGQSTSENYGLVSTGGEPLGGGQESSSSNYDLRSGFWLGQDSSTPPPTPTPGPVYIPLVVRPIPCLTPNHESEPNGPPQGEADGPLCLNQNYLGTPEGDNWDYFYFTLPSAGTFTVDLTNHALGEAQGVQMYLYYQAVSTGNLVGGPDLSQPYQLTYTGSPGTYYIVIYNDIAKCEQLNCSLEYTLRVTFPSE